MRFYAIITILFFISCNQNEEVATTQVCYRDWAEIKQDSVLTVLAENSPASYFVYKGGNMGYEYELLHEFAKDMNLRLQVIMVHNLDTVVHLLSNCKADLVAANITVTNKRKSGFSFSSPHLSTKMVLVQRKPEDDLYKDSLITKIEDLKNKKIHVWKNSTYYDQIKLINASYKLNMTIIATEGYLGTNELIRMVSDGEIELTIADKNVAEIALHFYSNLNIDVVISDSQDIAFVARTSSVQLLDTLNNWLNDKKNSSTIGEVRRKYFERSNLVQKANTEYSTVLQGQLTPYDDVLKTECANYGWDWRLIAAIMYQESKFETYKVSWAGAFGLFGFMPTTAASYGINRNSSPEAQIKAALNKLDKNYHEWAIEVTDSIECLNFTLATFNAGRAHIDDARLLCDKYGKDKNKWNYNVNEMLLNLSKPEYYRDPIVKNGYCRGTETYEYIIEVRQRYEEYKAAFPDNMQNNLAIKK